MKVAVTIFESFWPRMEHTHKPLAFTVPTPRQFTFAQVEPVPTAKQIDEAFKALPWAREIGVAATGEVFTRQSWSAKKEAAKYEVT